MCFKRLIVGLLLTGFLFAEEKNEPQGNPYAPPASSQTDEYPPLPNYRRSFAYGSAVGLAALYAIIISSTEGHRFLSDIPRIPPALWEDGNYRLRFSGIHLSAMMVFGGVGLAVRLLAGELRDYFSQPKTSKEPSLFDDLSAEPLAASRNCERSIETLSRNP